MWEQLLRPEVIAAALSALATAFAAIAAWKAPRAAALLAERLRRDGDAEQERRRIRFTIFSTVMQERAAVWSPEAVRALNLIDVAFSDVRPVRDAWTELLNAYGQNTPTHVREERLRKLLAAMADDLRLTGDLRLEDFGRIYYPEAMAQQREIEVLQRAQALRDLRGMSSPAANTAGPMTSDGPYPPPPSGQ